MAAALATARETREILVLTVGNPNTGKTTLVNALTGSRFQVGNWPGTTVDRLSASFRHSDRDIRLIDLPGSYSLAATTPEELIARNELLELQPDAVVNVLDAGNLERNLYQTLELSELGHPVLVALNLVDEARSKGLEVDADALSAELGLSVVPMVASRGEGVQELASRLVSARPARPQVSYPAAIERAAAVLEELLGDRAGRRWLALAALSGEVVKLPDAVARRAEELRSELESAGLDPFLEIAGARYRRAHELAHRALEKRPVPPHLTERIDRWVLHPWLGVPLFLAGMLFVFRFTFLLSDPWIEFVGSVQEVLGGWVAAFGLPGWLQSLVNDGFINGVGTVVAFAPVLFFLYLAMSFLEASGFLARAAFMADRMMQWAGLPGRGFIPLILGFGCNVPAIYATRTMEDFGDRLRVALAIPFMACSARLAVFALFASVFFPRNSAMVVFGLYLLGLVVGLGTAVLLGKLHKMGQSSGIMELPAYRMPTLRLLFRQAGQRTWSFIRGAGASILVAVLIVWFLLNVPPGDAANSLYAKASQAMIPLFSPMGVSDWRLIGALMPGFIAKEVVIGTLGVSYLGSEPATALGLVEGLRQLGQSFLGTLLAFANAIPALFGLPSFTPPPPDAPQGLPGALAASVAPAGALAYLVFVQLYTPCVATVAAIKQEFGRRWAVFSVVYQLVVAYLLALLGSRLL
ncbi:MAG: ferrous iron transport protein B [Candidatus Eremiobacterota bacterium]